MQRFNPAFVCGLEYISIEPLPGLKESQGGFYSYQDRGMRLRSEAVRTSWVYHETGHHVHNLGFLADIINDVLANTWSIGSSIYDHKKTCQDRKCFRFSYAMENPLEDWAVIFRSIVAHRLGTAAQMTFHLYDPNARKQAKKTYRAFDIIPNELRQYATIEFGQEKELPQSDVHISDGANVFLYSFANRSFSEYNLLQRQGPYKANITGRARMNPAKPPFAQFSRKYPEYMGIPIGRYVAAYGRTHYFFHSPIYAGTGIQFISRSHPGARLPRPIRTENIFGEIQRLASQELGYFSREPGKIIYWSHSIANNLSTKLAVWTLPLNYTPVHVLPLDDTLQDFFVVAMESDEPFRPDPRIKAFRLHRDSLVLEQSARTVKAGDYETLANDGWADMLLPFRMQNLIVFPTFHKGPYALPGATFGFFAYDLSNNRWVSIITRKISNLPAVMRDPPKPINHYQFLKDTEGNLHLLVSLTDGPTYEIPIKLEFCHIARAGIGNGLQYCGRLGSGT